jgi:hypothetical protein
MKKFSSLKIAVLLLSFSMLSIVFLASPVGAVTSPKFSNWYWTNDTNAAGIAVGDANNDGINDVVVVGYYNNGNGWSSQLHVLNSATYAIESFGSWNWGPNSQITSVAIGDVNGDGLNEVVTGGSYYDGTNWNSLVTVQTCTATSTTMTLLNIGAWRQGVKSQVSSVAIGDVNGDGKNDIVAVGSFNDGQFSNSLVNVIDPSTTSTALNMMVSTSWKWGFGSDIVSVAIGDVNADGLKEIVTAGSFKDAVRSSALLHVLGCAADFSGLTVLNYGYWYWTSDTYLNSVALAKVSSNPGLDIITGGSFNDGSRVNSMIHILNCTTASQFFTVEQTAYWVWTGNTQVNSVVVGNFTGGPTFDIVTGGSYFDGQRSDAQLMVLDSSNMAQRVVTTWFTTSDTSLNGIAVGVTPLGTRILAAGSFFDNTRSEAQLTVWA